MTADPLARPDLAGRFAAVRVVCAGMILLMLLIAGLIALVVQFALDGEPLAGNGVRLGGRPAITWVALAVAAAGTIAGFWFATSNAAAGVAKLAEEKPSDADADALAGAFAAKTFVEFAAAEAAGVGCAVLYHVTADPLMLVAVGGLAGLLAARFPTAGRTRAWFAAAAADLARHRGEV